MTYHPTEDQLEEYRLEAKMNRRSQLRYDLRRHQLGECGLSCGYCAEEDNPKTDPCENCGADMNTEGHCETALGYYCDACYQREYDRTFTRMKG